MVVLPSIPSFRLDGRRALVTGASRGLGLAVGAALAEAGASVTFAARDAMALDGAVSAVRARGGDADAAPIDVSDRAAFDALVDDRGRFDVYVNNAGTNRVKPGIEAADDDFDAVIGLNVKAAFFCATAVARSLVAAGRDGSIINVSSQMGHVSAVGRSLYSASKHAMEGFTKGSPSNGDRTASA